MLPKIPMRKNGQKNIIFPIVMGQRERSRNDSKKLDRFYSETHVNIYNTSCFTNFGAFMYFFRFWRVSKQPI